MDPYAAHARASAQLAVQLGEFRSRRAPVRLGKSTSNLFRRRDGEHSAKLDAGSLTRVLHVDPMRRVADVEGMVPYDALVEATLRHGLLPAVVPQLKSITVGGAVSGVGIESSSFRYGLVHETVEEMELLLGNGRIVVCSPHEGADLFFGFPNSYGTLGYALRLKVQLVPARRYVHVIHTRFSGPDSYFSRIADLCAAKRIAFLDGVIFDPGEMYLTEGVFTDQAPAVSDYTWMHVYYQSIRSRQEDWLTARGYIWRWDTDWFWCSKQFHAQHPLVRLLATKWLLNSRTWQRIMRLSHNLPARLTSSEGRTESVIQDVDIPLARASEFLEFLLSEIGITPIWICPIRAAEAPARFPLYPLAPETVYVNFGFWDMIPTRFPAGHFNRLVEEKLVKLGGIKGLYSSVYFDRETFGELYGEPAYRALKARYDPDGVFPDLYAKCTASRGA